jgi:hypothetical protein
MLNQLHTAAARKSLNNDSFAVSADDVGTVLEFSLDRHFMIELLHVCLLQQFRPPPRQLLPQPPQQGQELGLLPTLHSVTVNSHSHTSQLTGSVSGQPFRCPLLFRVHAAAVVLRLSLGIPGIQGNNGSSIQLCKPIPHPRKSDCHNLFFYPGPKGFSRCGRRRLECLGMP